MTVIFGDVAMEELTKKERLWIDKLETLIKTMPPGITVLLRVGSLIVTRPDVASAYLIEHGDTDSVPDLHHFTHRNMRHFQPNEGAN
jgi:hypothetical protein